MHIYSHAASIYPLHSFLLNLHNLVHTRLYTNQVLHQPAYTQTVFYTKHFLQKPTLQPTSFYTNPLFHKLVFPQTTIYTNQLLHKRVFAHSSFYANQLFDTSFTQTTFCTNQPALHNPCLGPAGQRTGGMPKAVKYGIVQKTQQTNCILFLQQMDMEDNTVVSPNLSGGGLLDFMSAVPLPLSPPPPPDLNCKR